MCRCRCRCMCVWVYVCVYVCMCMCMCKLLCLYVILCDSISVVHTYAILFAHNVRMYHRTPIPPSPLPSPLFSSSVRLRQIRVKNDSCTVRSLYEDQIDVCY